MTDLIALMSRLVAPDGRILIPGIYDNVAQLTPTEEAMYESISFTLNDIRDAVGGTRACIHSSERKALMARW